jgi:hypothetical protein
MASYCALLPTVSLLLLLAMANGISQAKDPPKYRSMGVVEKKEDDEEEDTFLCVSDEGILPTEATCSRLSGTHIKRRKKKEDDVRMKGRRKK